MKAKETLTFIYCYVKQNFQILSQKYLNAFFNVVIKYKLVSDNRKVSQRYSLGNVRFQ